MTPSAQKKGAPGHARIAAEYFLQSLARHGVDYFFANPGTDFPPIVEALTRAKRGNAKAPEPILVPHENLAVAMAHGVYLMTGRPQAVMVHVNVGTANTINNIANLARDRAPVIVAAGRTPFTEKGHFGSRTRPIHWAQEMFDQAGMVRELVKWDYELRMPDQIGDVTARAYEMAMTSPRGPVYLVLPREPLSAPLPDDYDLPKQRALPAPAWPDPQSIARLAEWLAAAERPVLLNAAAGDPQAVAALARIADDYAIPVVAHHPRVMALPASHPLHFGYDSAAMLAESDLAVVIECDVPYHPHLTAPAPGCRFVHIGEDTVYQRYPMRSFPTDLAITANAARALEALETALAGHKGAMQARIDARRGPLIERARARRAQAAQAGKAGPHITPEFLSRTIGEVLGEDAVIFNEYPLRLEHCRREKPGTYFSASPAGGLGWGLGAALGAKLAAPDKLIVATLGDGVYLFTNPTVSHWVGEKYKLPVLTVIFNNRRYGAVRNATLSMFKDGLAGEDDGRFLADLDPDVPYEELVRAQGGFGERVERPDELAGALARARAAVTDDKRQALLNVICPY